MVEWRYNEILSVVVLSYDSLLILQILTITTTKSVLYSQRALHKSDKLLTEIFEDLLLQIKSDEGKMFNWAFNLNFTLMDTKMGAPSSSLLILEKLNRERSG